MKRSIISGLALAGSAALVAMGAAPVSAATYDPLTVAYVEVNDNDLSLVGDYALEDGTPAFDVAIIFAANINTDDDGEAYLHLNERVQETLDDAENQIRPLQERGIKVTLSLLGNHDTSGFANFPTREAAEAFADQVDEVVTEYGLDGVDIDDEWVNYGSGDTAPANADSAAWLVDALDEKLPAGSIISLYDIGATAQTLTQAPTETLDRLDYIWNPYYGTYRPPAFPGVDRERLGAAAIDLTSTSSGTAARLAADTVADGYGVFVTYNLTPGDHSGDIAACTRELNGREGVAACPGLRG
jgi:hypothetical protein